MDTLEFKRIAPNLRAWHARLNGNGNDYDAICTVQATSEDVAEITGLMSRVPKGWHRIAKLGKPALYRMGFRTMTYRRNGVDYEEVLVDPDEELEPDIPV